MKQVNENQCHMCMPLGGVIAFKGIENAMVLVHGSQGCSTYMRLANVEHYNEPMDIASSSLNEKQTIYGGETNLRKALDNVIRVYQPKVLGIVTTCLAETIGEDLERMVETYVSERDLKEVDIIPVSTPSYSGSQTEGFWAATRELIAHYARPTEPHQRINVIIPHISPADIREIKRILDLMGLEYTLMPDYSMTLDRPYGGQYQKIPPGGTRTRDIAAMTGAQATIQFGLTCPDDLSPGPVPGAAVRRAADQPAVTDRPGEHRPLHRDPAKAQRPTAARNPGPGAGMAPRRHGRLPQVQCRRTAGHLW